MPAAAVGLAGACTRSGRARRPCARPRAAARRRRRRPRARSAAAPAPRTRARAPRRSRCSSLMLKLMPATASLASRITERSFSLPCKTRLRAQRGLPHVRPDPRRTCPTCGSDPQAWRYAMRTRRGHDLVQRCAVPDPETCGPDAATAHVRADPGAALSLRWRHGDCERAHRGGGRGHRGGGGARARSRRARAHPALAAADAAARRARARALQAGQAARLVLHLQGQRGRRRSASPRRWRPTIWPRRCTATSACTSTAASSRGGCSASTWAASAGTTNGRDSNLRTQDVTPRHRHRRRAARTCRRSCRSPSAPRSRSACAASRGWRSAGSATARRPTARRTSR